VIAAIAPQRARLTAAQKRLWPRLEPSLALGFVLYGGTAISLRLGHRRSVDFDFFHVRALEKDALRSRFGFMAQARTLQDSRITLVVSVGGLGRDPVKLSFSGGLGFGRVGDPAMTQDGVVQVASLDDLMAHKLKVILQRPEKKDYQDIAAMIRAGCDLAQGLAAARLLFGAACQPAASLKALVYFADGDLPRLPRAERTTLIAAASSVGPLPVLTLRSRSLAIPIA